MQNDYDYEEEEEEEKNTGSFDHNKLITLSSDSTMRITLDRNNLQATDSSVTKSPSSMMNSRIK